MQHTSVPNSDDLMQFLALLALSSRFAAIQSNGGVAGENICTFLSANGDGPGCEITRCPDISGHLDLDSDIMTCPDERTLEQGYLLGTFPRLGKWWTISLEFKPSEKPHPTKISNIIKLNGDSIHARKRPNITGISTRKGSNDTGITRMGPNAAGIFSIWTHPDQDLHFSGTHGDKAWSKNYNGTQVGHWIEISFSQRGLEAQDENCLKYQQVIHINGKELGQRINKAPQEFDKVDVDASANPSWRSQPGVIKNFVLENKNAGPMSDLFSIAPTF